MSTFKRKRSGPSSGTVAIYSAPKACGGPQVKRRKKYVAGSSRSSGYYGRYNSSGGELKFFDTSKSLTTAASAGVVTVSFLLIPQGTTESTRIGRRATMKSFNLHYAFRLPNNSAAVSLPDDSVRFILFQDKQCNGTNAVVTDVLESANIRSFRNLANTGRFNVLMDKTHNLNYSGIGAYGAGTVEQNGGTKNYKFSKTLNMPIEWDNTAGAITEIRSNNIAMLIISDRGNAQYIFQARVRYSD